MQMLFSIVAAILLVSAIQALARTLPLQNIALIVGSLMALELVLQIVWQSPGAVWCDLLFWPATIIWSRIVIRWALRRRRQEWNYGICLVVLASAATALLQLSLALAGTSWSVAIKHAGVRFAEAAVCLCWLAPWFISKLSQKPQEQA
jgi:hypothetical protein